MPVRRPALGRDGEIAMQHYAFLISNGAGETYPHNGGRGVYFDDPDGHLLEVMTRPCKIGA